MLALVLEHFSDTRAVFLGVLILSLVYVGSKVLLGPLKNVPGPFLARFTRLWELKQNRNGNFEAVNISLHRKYGTVVRIAPNRFSISDPAALRIIYGHGSKFNKSLYYHPFPGPSPKIGGKKMDDPFTQLDPAKHSRQRRGMANMYSMSTLTSYEPYVDATNERLMQKLDELSKQGTPFNLFDYMQFYAFDVIGEITVGKSFGLIEAGHDTSGLLHGIHFGNVTYSAAMGLVPELHDWYLLLCKMFGIKNPSDKVQTAITSLISKRDAGETSSDRQDFMSKALASQKEGKLNAQDVRATVGSNIGAGSDTTGITLTAAFYYLMRNPSCLQRLRHEIDTVDRDGRLSDPATFAEAQKLPYLNAVIKEALRMHPAVGTILPRVVPAGGSEIAGTFFPEGSVVGMNAWVVQREPTIWGPDADSFNPDRWLGEDAGKMEQNMLAFGAGSRTCLGKNISLLEMTKVIPQIVRAFDFKASESEEWTTSNGWFVKQHHMVKVAKREIEV